MSNRTWRHVIAAAVSLSAFTSTVWAQDSTPISGPVSAHESFAAYVHDLHALNADVSFATQPWGYGGNAHIRSIGMIGWFVRMDVTARMEGHFGPGNTVAPILYDSAGLSRGAQRHVHLDYQNNTPTVTVHTPPETDRDPVPSSTLPGTIDTFSGMVRLLQTMRNTGQCNGSANVFDGARLTHITVHGPVADNVPTDHDQLETGAALRCDFVGQQVAGFIKDSPNRAKMASPQPGAVWFKNVQGFGLLPVRVEFEHPKLGHISLVLQTPITH
ncbi:DUF3108 domain-containing protein [Neokomagataea anthophila]|uniref:DUF3108 domain-containing protein n=1 Tax=Neokomagataea anthophila TaxID=2826925 RepID=A0ABS5E6S4_9PROT|nr:DUF3108 domain-containing protein [Neokomagataea anthophila]MBR0559610.1 DUF3108 domain-containing protein [Neokomagataea anthophila]